MRSCELNESDEEGEWSCLSDTRDDVIADLSVIHGWRDGRIADAHNEEKSEGKEEGNLHILVLCCVPPVSSQFLHSFESRRAILREGNACEDVHEVETELANRDLPSGALKAKVEHDLSCDTVDCGEENPSVELLAN